MAGMRRQTSLFGPTGTASLAPAEPAGPGYTKDALFSPCRRYRWWLTRTWNPELRPLVIIGINPSVANEAKNDPTAERCERRARALGLGGLVIVNLFAWVSTSPKVLLQVEDPIGPANDEMLRWWTREGLVVAAWGAGLTMGRDKAVLELLADRDLHVLKLTKHGRPEHPLYLPYVLRPTLWRAAS